MRTPRQAARTSSGWRQNRSARAGGQSSLPAVSAATHNVGALVREADNVVAEAERLRSQIFKQQQESRRARMELEHDVSETVRMDTERLAYEREGLEVQLAEHMRQLHSLEQKGMEHSQATRERKQYARGVAAQLRKLMEVDLNDTESRSLGDEGMKALKGMHRQLEVEKRGIEDELQRAYNLKERTEMEIADRRQALAINEALLRARYERQMVPSEFDEPSSLLDDGQLNQASQYEVFS